MEYKDNIVISKYAFERMQAKDEMNDRWRNIIIIVLIILLVVTNAMWLVAWNQYDYVYDDYTEVDADDAWMVMDELAEAVKVLQPKLYQATIDRLKEQ